MVERGEGRLKIIQEIIDTWKENRSVHVIGRGRHYKQNKGVRKC